MGCDMSLSNTQKRIIDRMQEGAVIGELSDKFNGRYELFMRKKNWLAETKHPLEHPFQIRRLNKNTVFALLALGLIRKDNSVAKEMKPFSRDVWYVFEANR